MNTDNKPPQAQRNLKCDSCSRIVEEKNIFSHVEEDHIGIRSKGSLYDIACGDCNFQSCELTGNRMIQHIFRTKHQASMITLQWKALMIREERRVRNIILDGVEILERHSEKQFDSANFKAEKSPEGRPVTQLKPTPGIPNNDSKGSAVSSQNRRKRKSATETEKTKRNRPHVMSSEISKESVKNELKAGVQEINSPLVSQRKNPSCPASIDKDLLFITPQLHADQEKSVPDLVSEVENSGSDQSITTEILEAIEQDPRELEETEVDTTRRPSPTLRSSSNRVGREFRIEPGNQDKEKEMSRDEIKSDAEKQLVTPGSETPSEERLSAELSSFITDPLLFNISVVRDNSFQIGSSDSGELGGNSSIDAQNETCRLCGSLVNKDQNGSNRCLIRHFTRKHCEVSLIGCSECHFESPVARIFPTHKRRAKCPGKRISLKTEEKIKYCRQRMKLCFPNHDFEHALRFSVDFGDCSGIKQYAPKVSKREEKAKKGDCHICPLNGLKDIHSRVNHAMTHTDLRLFECSNCRNRFKNTSSVKWHANIPRNSECDGSFNTVETPEDRVKIRETIKEAFPEFEWDDRVFSGRKFNGIQL